jgi:hypothetical protein
LRRRRLRLLPRRPRPSCSASSCSASRLHKYISCRVHRPRRASEVAMTHIVQMCREAAASRPVGRDRRGHEDRW